MLDSVTQALDLNIEFGDFDPTTWPIEKRNDICYLSLSSRVDCYCILDRIDYEWAKKWLWCHSYSRIEKDYQLKPHCGIYARRSVKIEGLTAEGRPRYGNLWLHREVCRRKSGRAPEGFLCDHKNGNSLDNRRKNLRWVSIQENAVNKHGSSIRKYFISRIPVFTRL